LVDDTASLTGVTRIQRKQEREKGGPASMDQFRGVTFQILFTVPVASTKEKEFTVRATPSRLASLLVLAVGWLALRPLSLSCLCSLD
jgi:hypothetical protein